MSFYTHLDLWGLALSAFLAATILPLSSELVFSALLLAGEEPLILILIATSANVAGSIVNYLIGRWGASTILYQWFHLTTKQTAKAEQHFNRFGKWSLLFSWLPLIGDPLTFLAGILKVNIASFIILVTIGKAFRYWIISHILMSNQL